MQTPQELIMTVTTPIATRFDAQAAALAVTAVKPATVETNSIEEGDGCNGRLGAGLTERNLTSRWVGQELPWTPKTAQQTVQAGASGAIPKSAEFQSFAAVTDSALGTPLSPVDKTTDGTWVQVRTVSTVFETTSGFIAWPN